MANKQQKPMSMNQVFEKLVDQHNERFKDEGFTKEDIEQSFEETIQIIETMVSAFMPKWALEKGLPLVVEGKQDNMERKIINLVAVALPMEVNEAQHAKIVHMLNHMDMRELIPCWPKDRILREMQEVGIEQKETDGELSESRLFQLFGITKGQQRIAVFWQQCTIAAKELGAPDRALVNIETVKAWWNDFHTTRANELN